VDKILTLSKGFRLADGLPGPRCPLSLAAYTDPSLLACRR